METMRDKMEDKKSSLIILLHAFEMLKIHLVIQVIIHQISHTDSVLGILWGYYCQKKD